MNTKKGFTLIELLVVVAIIGVLAAVAIPKLLEAIDKAKEGVVKSDIGSMNSALQMYQINHPENKFISMALTTFVAAGTFEANMKPTYLGVLPKSPFGSSYNYTYGGDGANYTFFTILGKKKDPQTIEM